MRRRQIVRALLAACLVALLAGCRRQAPTGQQSPSTMSPYGPKSSLVTFDSWVLFAVAGFVCLVIILLAVLAVVFRRHPKRVHTDSSQGVVVAFGIVIPSIVFAGVFAMSVTGIAGNAAPPSATKVTVDVTGHQWWWAARYPQAGFTTANEIHIPVGTPVKVVLRTADVIHSFWVPQLTPKTDLIPNRPNTIWLSADRAGVYRGECAEYCGLQHANMDFQVVAQPRAAFQKWLSGQQGPARTPTTAEERAGLKVFTTSSCTTCHTIRGTSANGKVGPDLTHVASRSRLAAGVIPNDFGNMAGWVANSQTIKPGNKMPPQSLSPDDLRSVVTYLQSLK